MKKFIKSKLVLQICLTVFIVVFAAASIVSAATTIGANVTTTGTLSVTGASTLTGAVTTGTTLTAGGNVILENSEVISNTTDGTVNITDGTNTLISILDYGTTGRLNVTGSTTISNDLTVNTNDFAVDADGGITLVPTSGEVDITGSTTISADLNVNSNDLFVDADGGITIAPNSGELTITGSSTVSANLAVSNNLTVGANYSLDTAAAGTLNIGTSTATAITIGANDITTAIAGNVTVPANYSLDTAAAGTLNIGTSTANAITIGASDITTDFPGLATMANASSTLANFGGGTTISSLLFGNCSVNFGTSIAAKQATTTDCTATGVDSTYEIFMTPANLEADLVFNSASSTSSGIIQVGLFNISSTTAVTTSAKTWSWMGIKSN